MVTFSTKADSQLAVLDFFLAHRAVPYVPCTSRHGLFAPRGIARSEIRLPDCEELNGVKQFCKNCETELHSSERCVIQDIRPLFNRASVLRRILFMQGDGSTHLMYSITRLQKHENKKARNKSNKGNQYADWNKQCLMKQCQAAVCLSA